MTSPSPQSRQRTRRRTSPSKEALKALDRYLALIVDPTIDDFQRNPLSVRHAYAACVVTFHAVDRLERKGGNVKKEWTQKSSTFALVEVIANTLKHVSMDAPTMPRHIPFKAAMPGTMALNTHTPNEHGPDVRNIYFAVRDAVAFIREWAAKAAIGASPDPDRPPVAR